MIGAKTPFLLYRERVLAHGLIHSKHRPKHTIAPSEIPRDLLKPGSGIEWWHDRMSLRGLPILEHPISELSGWHTGDMLRPGHFLEVSHRNVFVAPWEHGLNYRIDCMYDTKTGNAMHTCFAIGCTEQVPKKCLGCREHWFALPTDMRNRIKSAWRTKQRDVHLELARKAMLYLKDPTR